MKIKHILMAGVIAISSISLPTLANAEEVFTTPQELISAMLTDAVASLTDADYSEAIDDYINDIVLSTSQFNHEVTSVSHTGDFTGEGIGVWRSTDPNMITTQYSGINVIEYLGPDEWNVQAGFLSKALREIAPDLISTEVPLNENLIASINSYDITVGDVPLDLTNRGYLGGIYPTSFNDALQSHYFDFYNKTHVNLPDVVDGTLRISYVPYKVTTGGDLYLYTQISTMYIDKVGGNILGEYAQLDGQSGKIMWRDSLGDTAYDTLPYGEFTRIRILYHEDEDGDLMFTPLIRPQPQMEEGYIFGYADNANIAKTEQKFLKVGASSEEYTDQSLMHEGIYIFNSQGLSITPKTVEKLFTEPIRTSQFYTLSSATMLHITLNGISASTESVDSSTQHINSAGTVADVPTIANVEAMSFSVVVPTSLPVYVDTKGITYVADNAAIENYSGAAVQVSNVAIEATTGTGWTLVNDALPSDVRDAKEFAMSTSLVPNTSIAKGELLPFKYNVAMSPVTDGVTDLDLASVLITVGWAD